MGIVVHPGRLRQELARRGWCGVDLAREAGVSPPTVTAALGGRAISAKSLALIVRALARTPVLEVVDGLLFVDEPDPKELG